MQLRRRERRLRVVWQMSALNIWAFTREIRGANALIPGSELRFFRELFEFVDDGGAAREPKREAGADVVVEGEKLEFLAELAMVALLCFLEHGEVFVELGLVLEGGA